MCGQVLLVPLDELQIAPCQIRSTFKDGNDATITKPFGCVIFVEVQSTFLLVIEEVEVLFGKFLLEYLLVFASCKSC